MLPGLHDIAGEPDSFYDDLVDCPWCGGFHDADDDPCPAMPTDAPEHDDDIDWADWIGEVA
ncbi:hypothetical protein [Gordonia sp. N1V]|uniref:hypothetical protein n=1 Tax=Gordonia sp. N1V TaxID=3034163 RepID=UPI0023E240C7|nr:hypothetical protein [Gordonia sp. N1V]MDF3280448.1 hypothetical protein [Gordonia sp. N1V]